MEEFLQSEAESSPWPAFADLFASSSLLFLILFAAVTIPAIKRNHEEDAKKTTLHDLRAVLAADTSKGYRLVPYGDHLLVRIPDSATFPQGRYELEQMRPGGRQILSSVTNDIRSHELLGKVYQVGVVGHTSSEGGDARNWLLSAQRAVTVALYLVQQEGLSPCVVSAEGRGKYYPVDAEAARRDANVDGMAQDRRIELEIWPKIVGDSAQIRNTRNCVDPRSTTVPTNGVTAASPGPVD